MSPSQKQALTMQALGILNEQVQARIVHYKSELETSPELDAVTAQVVAEIRAMQQAVAKRPGSKDAPDDVETKQVKTLVTLLERLFDPASGFVSRNLKAIGRKLAKQFFASELHQKTGAQKDKVIHHAEQGVYYVLQRYKHRLRTDLESFSYVSPEIRELTLSRLASIERDLQVAFLSRRSPELNRIMTIYTAVVTEFLQKHFPRLIPQAARGIIEGARTARRENSLAYKIHRDAFSDFRTHWERFMMQQMVDFCSDELVQRLAQSNEPFHDETLALFTDPHVFSDTCGSICEAIYDYLCQQGFLDLPLDWRVRVETDT